MMKKMIYAIVAVFITFSIVGFIVHGLILAPAYQATASLWRPMAEMKMGLIYFVYLLTAFVFVFIYSRFVGEKNTKNALLYGVLFGFGAGVSMGYGTFSSMPIPYFMALTWFLGNVVEYTIAGWLVGMIVKN